MYVVLMSCQVEKVARIRRQIQMRIVDHLRHQPVAGHLDRGRGIWRAFCLISIKMCIVLVDVQLHGVVSASVLESLRQCVYR